MEAVAVLFSIPRAAWGGLDPNVGQKDTGLPTADWTKETSFAADLDFRPLSVAKLNTPRPLACD